METRDYIIYLYDYYHTLLTEKQQNYFEAYYFENFTLSEIASNEKVSRNAVHKEIKLTEEKLYSLEEKLKLYDKAKKIKELLQGLDPKIKEEIEELI